jgi:hypothetical protein
MVQQFQMRVNAAIAEMGMGMQVDFDHNRTRWFGSFNAVVSSVSSPDPHAW